MPALSTITVSDRESTPVAHSFEPYQIDKNGVAVYRDYDANGVPLGDNILSIGINETAERLNGTLKLSMPTLSTTTDDGGNDTYGVSRVARVTVSVSFDKESTSQERANAIGLVQSALASSIDQVNAVFVENQRVY